MCKSVKNKFVNSEEKWFGVKLGFSFCLGQISLEISYFLLNLHLITNEEDYGVKIEPSELSIYMNVEFLQWTGNHCLVLNHQCSSIIILMAFY
jgi:hypothetical protein